MENKNIKTAAASNPAGSATTDAPNEFREMAEKGTAQAKANYERMSAATTEAGGLIANSYAMGFKGMQDCNNKFVEFAHANINSAFDFLQRLSSAPSPSAYVELSSEHARKQIETLTEQTKQLAALVQKGTLAAVEPIRTGVAKAFNQSI